MKNTFLFVSVAVLALASCSREASDFEMGGDSRTVRGIIDDDIVATRSILVDNPGIKLESKWQEGDAIAIFGSGVQNRQLVISARSISANGKTADFTSTDEIPASDLFSYSPYQAGATMDGNELVLDFPAVQHYHGYAGVSTPDPRANILVANGTRNSGLPFRSTLSVLKIGQVFEESVTLARVEFRDLDGKPVCGEMHVTLSNPPQAAFTGNGNVLTLDFGEGLEMDAGSLQPLFLIVPARAYPRGFEVKFVPKEGDPIVKTVGTKMGKVLERGVIYTIGDIDSPGYAPGASTQLYSQARIVTPELMDLATVLSKREDYLRDENGRICYDANEQPIFRPEFDMMVHKDFQPSEGNWLIFDKPSDDLPYGGVYKVTSCERLDDTYYRIYVKPELNIFAPFKEMTAGSPLFDEEGNFLEDGGFDIDLAATVQSITDENGHEIAFYQSPEGDLYFGEKETAEMLGLETRGMLKHKFTLPSLDVNLKSHDDSQTVTCEAAFSSKMTLELKAAAKIIDGSLQYLHFTAQPALSLEGKFSVKAAIDKSLRRHIYTMRLAPVLVAPGVLIVPTIDFDGSVSVGGTIKFTTSLKYVHDFGMYGLSYNNGDGFTFRHRVPDPAPDDGFTPGLEGAEGTLYASCNLVMSPIVSIYALMGAGVEANMGLQFGIVHTPGTGGVKLALTPSLEFTPKVSSLGGYLTYTFKEFTGAFSWDPIWERWIVPYAKRTLFDFSYHWTDKKYRIPGLDYAKVVPSGLYATYDFILEHPTLSDFDVAVYVYEASGPIDWSTNKREYTWVSLNDEEHTILFDDFVRGGYPHLWPHVVPGALTSYDNYDSDVWQLASRLVVGRFRAGTEDPQQFTGDVPYEFESGKLYRLVGKLIGATGSLGDTAVTHNHSVSVLVIPYFSSSYNAWPSED